MKFDTWLLSHNLKTMPTVAQAADEIGFDGLWTSEGGNDGFLPLVLAAEHSQRMNLGTSIATAFPRTPTVLAHIAWDLANYSRGRFILGLGAQVKAHNERRLGVKWEKPIRRMRETVEAMHAIWDSWQHGTRLK
ncbi:MAG: LLM class flavin-dependent oxidoreductase, partial [Chloroflexota bacterium]